MPHTTYSEVSGISAMANIRANVWPSTLDQWPALQKAFFVDRVTRAGLCKLLDEAWAHWRHKHCMDPSFAHAMAVAGSVLRDLDNDWQARFELEAEAEAEAEAQAQAQAS